MPDVFRYSASPPITPGVTSLRKGDFYIGAGAQNFGSTFFTGISPPSGGYTIYQNKASQGPSIYVVSNDAQLTGLTNTQVAGTVGSPTNYVNAQQCFSYFNGQNDKIIVNRDYESIVVNGLVGFFDAGYLPSYPTSGTTWNNLRTTGNGTLTNGPTFQSTSGGTISFDGTDDYVSVNTSLGSSITTTCTSSFWIYRTTTFNTSNTDVGQFIFGVYTNDSNRGVVYFSSDGGYVGTIGSLLVDGGSITGRVYTQQNSWSPGWYNIVFVRTSSSYKIYVNGTDMALTTVVNSANKAFPASPTYVLMGANYFSSLNVYGFYPGNIANALFYNRVLSASEVSQNYNAQKGRFGL